MRIISYRYFAGKPEQRERAKNVHERDKGRLVSRNRRFDVGGDAADHSFIRDAKQAFSKFSRHTLLFLSHVLVDTCTGRVCVCTHIACVR